MGRTKKQEYNYYPKYRVMFYNDKNKGSTTKTNND